MVAVRNCYGPAHQFFVEQLQAKFNIEVTFVPGEQVSDFESAIRENTQFFYLESPSSLILSLQDLAAVAALAKKHHIRTAIDNTWCTPLFQKPLTLGIDISLHTLSKYIGGHSDMIGGALICADEALWHAIKVTERELLGGILGSFEAWLAIRGLRSLPARLALHQQNALTIADRLAKAPKIARLYYPGHPSDPQYALGKRQMQGYGSLMSILPDANLETTFAFVNRLELFRRGCSWGGFESLVVMPMAKLSDAEAEAAGGARNLVRLFVGQEHVEDLWADLEQAMRVLS